MTKSMMLAATVLLSGLVFAADKPKERDIRIDTAESKKEGELNPALKALNFLEGRWKVEQRMKPAYSDKGGEAHGTFIIHRDLNGNALVGNFEADKSSKVKEFEGHLVISAAQAKAGGVHKDKGISVFWADSEGNVSLSNDVRAEANKFMATFDAHKHGDRMVKGRVTYSKVSDDKLEFTMEQDSGKGWEKVATAEYTKMGRDATDVKYEKKKEMQTR